MIKFKIPLNGIIHCNPNPHSIEKTFFIQIPGACKTTIEFALLSVGFRS